MKYLGLLENNPTDTHTLTQFFDAFGTHFVKGVDMGDKFVTKTEFSRKEMYKQEAMGRAVEFSASAGGWGFSASVGYGQQESSNDKNRNTNLFYKTSMYTIGTPLPRGSNVKQQIDQWILNEKADMTGKVHPVGNLELVPIPTVLEHAFRE